MAIDRLSTTTVPASLRNQRGQALLEAAFVVPLMVLLLLGIIEFGRGFMIANVITNAARAGARTASLTPSAARDGNGLILNTTPIEDAVRDVILTADPADQFTSTLTVNVVQTDGTVPTVEVQVTGDIPFLFGVPTLSGSGGAGPSSFTVDRSVTFPDQNR